MAEQTFKSPGFFEREIEVISRPLTRNSNTPVGVIGPAKKGQAFVPKTITSTDEFIKEFGMPDQDTSAAHAISEFFSNGGKAATFCRILGTGDSNSDGTVNYAGFKLSGTTTDTNRSYGGVQFIAAEHVVDAAEHITYGIMNDNDSLTTAGGDVALNGTAGLDDNGDKIQLIRAMIFMHKDYTLRIGESTDTAVGNTDADDLATATNTSSKTFKLYVRHHTTAADVAVYEVSLDPKSDSYITKALNTDSFSFTEKKHFLYADFPVEDTVASTKEQVVTVLRPRTLADYDDFSSRFETPRTTSFISQPFGKKEYDLFHFESLDDGAYASGDYKISIRDLLPSSDPSDLFGTFTVELRKIDDTDETPVVLESYSRCSLNPNSSNYIARLIGDQKLSLSLDVESEDEKRLIREGTFPNLSSRIRVVMSSDVIRGEVPEDCLPFGFRGIPTLRTTSDGRDGHTTGAATSLLLGKGGGRIAGDGSDNDLASAVLPPLPFRAKVTKGLMQNTDEKYFQTYFGQVLDGSDDKISSESVKESLYWGLHTSKVKDIKNPNNAGSLDFNPLILNLTKFLTKNDTRKFSGVKADEFNNNKFSLAKVVFPTATLSEIDSSSADAFLEAVYVRNADVTSEMYDPITNIVDMNVAGNDPFDLENSSGDTKQSRASLAKLLAEDKVKFTKVNSMAKFTAPFYGGFDGVNILDRDDFFFTDKASSAESGGHANSGGYTSGLKLTNDATNKMQGVGLKNNAVMSYMNAVRLMSDELVIDHNVLTVPGIREPLITDFTSRRVKDFGKAIYLMDMPHYESSGSRVFVSSRGIASGVADVDMTSSKFDQREVDSSYVATYFPDVMIKDSGDDENARLTNHRLVRVPSSVVALGALARTDAVSQPWFAPAGFSRGSLSNVTSLDVRLNAADRDTLYELRINPIANLPNNQFVIFGQKTTQISRTALDRVNVRRLMINIKRRVQKIAQGLLFEQNDVITRDRFTTQVSSVLADIRVKQGIEDFRVIMDSTNNTAEDVDNNRLNGRIVVVPTRAVEFIAMDFIITNSGVEFPS
jgi:hypothetical protein